MKWLYYRFIYRVLMQLAHRYNWHHTDTIYPDGDTLLVCRWCGLSYVKAVKGVPIGIFAKRYSDQASGERS